MERSEVYEDEVSKLKNIAIVLICIAAPVVFLLIYYRTDSRAQEWYATGALDPVAYSNAIGLIDRTLLNNEYDYLKYLADHAFADAANAADTADAADTAAGGDIILLEVPEEDRISLGYHDTYSANINVTAPGFYNLYVSYMIPEDTLLPVTISLYLNGTLPFRESRTLDLPLLFADVSKEYDYDRFGDEVLPLQERIRDWRGQRLFDNNYTDYNPTRYYLTEGGHEITIQNICRSEIWLSEIKLIPAAEPPSHEDYIAAITAEYNVSYDNPEKLLMEIEANQYVYKVSTDLGIGSWHDPSFSRYDPQIRRINYVFWYLFGSEVAYEVEVPQDGFYAIALHYRNYAMEISNFQTIYVNGEIPSKAFAAVESKATGLYNMDNMEFVDPETQEPYKVFLKKGTNIISVRGDRGGFTQTINDLQKLLLHMGEFVLDVKKIAGNDIDLNRTWRLTRHLPETTDYLDAYRVILEQAVRTIAPFTKSGINSENVAYLLDAIAQIELLSEYPDELPLRLHILSGESGAAADYIAYALEFLLYQSMTLNKIYIYNNTELPDPDASFWVQLSSTISQIYLSYVSDKYRLENDPKAVNVWVNLSQLHISMMQKMVDADFTPRTGIEVKISLMPDTSKLILANASGETPDCAIGLTGAYPFDLASRNVLYDMTEQDDFWQVASRFPAGALVSYVFNEGVYAIPDRLNFNALVYRTDVFNKLELTPPDTWQDVVDILPELQRFGMDFYHPVATGIGYKYFYQTLPIIYQHDGSLFTEDGLGINVSRPEAMAGIRLLGALFTKYSLPVQVPSFFNSFRTATVPVGIADINIYNLIKNASPELEGLWSLAPHPGIRGDNGEVSRWYMADSFACVIFNDSPHKDNAWEFLKWWTSADTQMNFAKNMQTMFGRTYIWMSSNKEALSQMPIDPDDLEIILDQLEWYRSPPYTPGYYELERSLSNIWNTMVFDGTPAQIAVDRHMLSIAREMEKKMRELGFIDNEGNPLKPYTVRELDWVVGMLEKYG